jgi:hypothetical protein
MFIRAYSSTCMEVTAVVTPGWWMANLIGQRSERAGVLGM